MRSVRGKKEDSAVAEIIGAILLFGIAVTLVTSYLAWYVPVSQTNNELTYVRSAYSDMTSLSDQIHSLSSGSQISMSFSMGVSGTFPIIPAQDTELMVSNSSAFSYNSTVTLNITLQNSTGSLHYYNLTVLSNESGYIGESAPLQYVQENSIYVADDMVVQSYQSLPASVSGPSPVLFSGNGGIVNVSAVITGISSRGVAYSSTSPETVLLNPTGYHSIDLTNKSLTGIDGNISLVRGIKMQGFNYTISTPYTRAIDLFMYREMNGTMTNSSAILGLSHWHSSNGYLSISLRGNHIFITQGNKIMNINSINYLSVSLMPLSDTS